MTSTPRTVVARAAGVGLVGGAVGAATNLLLATTVGHALGTAGAGAFFQTMAMVTIAANVLELGADTGLVRHVSAVIAQGRGDRIRGLVRIAVFPVVAASALAIAVGVVAAPWLAHLTGGGRGWVGITVLCAGLAALIAVLLGAVRAMSSALSVTLVQNVGLPLARLALVGVCVTTVSASWRAVTLAWLAPLPVALLAAVVLLIRAERRHRVPPPPRATSLPVAAERREFWAFSAPRGLGAATEICLEWADVLIVGALCSSVDAGIYAVVTRAARSAELVQQASRIALGPVISRALTEGRWATVRRLHHDVALGTTLLSWPFFTIGAYFAPALLGLFGPGFAEGATALRILCLGMALAYAAGGVQSILLMGGRSTAQLGNKVACLAMNVGLDLALVPRFGIVGAAIGWAVVLVLDAGLAWWQILTGLRLRLGLRSAYLLGAAVAAATAGVCVLVDALDRGPLGQGRGSVAAPIAAALTVTIVGGAGALMALRALRARRARRVAEHHDRGRGGGLDMSTEDRPELASRTGGAP